MWLGPIKSGCMKFPAGLRTILHPGIFGGSSCSAAPTPKRGQADNIWRLKPRANDNRCEAIRLHQVVNGYSGIGLQHARDKKKLRLASLFGEAPIHPPNHRASPRLLSVTESVALPPPQKRRSMSNISKFSVREWPGIAADPFRAVDRRCSGYSVVVSLDRPAPSTQANC
jgi:hypothetical protein